MTIFEIMIVALTVIGLSVDIYFRTKENRRP